MLFLKRRERMKIIEDVKKGENALIYDFVNLYGCEIGDNTKIASFVEIILGLYTKKYDRG